MRRFRASILELRRDPRLIDKLYERKDRVHARLLPGYDAKGLDRSGGSFFVIGPAKQLDAWDQYLQGIGKHSLGEYSANTSCEERAPLHNGNILSRSHG